MQERKKITETMACVKHYNTDNLIINVAQQCSARYLGAYQPRFRHTNMDHAVMQGAMCNLHAQQEKDKNSKAAEDVSNRGQSCMELLHGM